MKIKPVWTITITRVGTRPPEVIEKIEIYDNISQIEAERRLSDTWGSDYSSSPGRFRAKLRDAQGNACMTID